MAAAPRCSWLSAGRGERGSGMGAGGGPGEHVWRGGVARPRERGWLPGRPEALPVPVTFTVPPSSV